MTKEFVARVNALPSGARGCHGVKFRAEHISQSVKLLAAVPHASCQFRPEHISQSITLKAGVAHVADF